MGERGDTHSVTGSERAEVFGSFRRLLRAAVSVYLWFVLITLSLAWSAIAWIRAPLLGRERSWSCILTNWAHSNLVMGFFKLRCAGREAIRGPVVIAANHQGAFDINILAAALPQPFRFVARAEVARVPIVGWCLRLGGHILVDRNASVAGEQMLQDAERLLRSGSSVVFFPEGTRSRDGRIGPLKSGAFRAAERAGVPVVPTVISGSRDTIPVGTGLIIPSRVAVTFLAPRRITREESRSDDYREAVRAEMSATLARLAEETGPRV